ncbi:unnamed protein product [Euphydryas editha]|uniref:Uncharacterized protein n=1 Tax=Euphydryas editha TaxID=104508 RepID=A0AAU9TRI6_EUPED|nr:unnamed protein product [Euphydryas editha]
MQITSTSTAPFEKGSLDNRWFWLGKNEKPPDVVAFNIHERKRILFVALVYDGIAFYRLLDQGQAITASVYISILNEEILE